MSLERSIREIHFPEEFDNVDTLNRGTSPAHVRLIFDDFFLLELGLALMKKKEVLETGISFKDKNILNISVNGTLHKIKFANTFSDAKNDELLCYKGSNNTLEIAANLASAKDIININIGDHITIEK